MNHWMWVAYDYVIGNSHSVIHEQCMWQRSHDIVTVYKNRVNQRWSQFHFVKSSFTQFHMINRWLQHQVEIDRSLMLAYKMVTAYLESRITREMVITCFSNKNANEHFVAFDLGCFLDLIVFTLLSHKGKISVIFPPCLHSILNTCNISVSAFTYSCIKAELVKLCTCFISPSNLMWVAAVIT